MRVQLLGFAVAVLLAVSHAAISRPDSERHLTVEEETEHIVEESKSEEHPDHTKPLNAVASEGDPVIEEDTLPELAVEDTAPLEASTEPETDEIAETESTPDETEEGVAESAEVPETVASQLHHSPETNGEVPGGEHYVPHPIDTEERKQWGFLLHRICARQFLSI